MQAILLMLMQPLIQAAVSAFGHVLLDLFQSWRDHADAVALGRADAERAAVIAAGVVAARMEAVNPLTDAEIADKLRKGEA